MNAMIEPKDLPEPPDGSRVLIVWEAEECLAYRSDDDVLGDKHWFYAEDVKPWVSWGYLIGFADEIYVVPPTPSAKRKSR